MSTEIKQSPVKQALTAIKDLKQRLDKSERSRQEPIAIVGIGCRFAGGADSPQKFWDLLANGVDAVTEVPQDRWDANAYFSAEKGAAGKSYARWGSFLTEADKFDPKFFGISPREAVGMDPQQRVSLEVAWEALENSGLPARSLTGSKTGVFLGVMNQDYYLLQLRQRTVADFNAYSATGGTFSVIPGRLSYFLGLQGPCIAVDTACASSLVAIDLACRSLRNSESEIAIAGGVNMFFTPETYLVRAQASMLSPTGRCHTFDASADGYVPGEGCGIVILKRLSDARRDGDNIVAVIRGSAVNHDGPSSGLTVPNGVAQQALLRQALQNARVKPNEVGYVEAHGTGTPLGDPIEVNALAAAFGKDRPADAPLLLGSVKTNLGHLESAAGVAGLIKVALSLQHKQIPPHLHLNEVNPRIDFSAVPAEVPRVLTDWNPKNGTRIAGVSSFALNGTNSHVILEESPAANPDDPTAAPEPRAAEILLISARSRSALNDYAQRYAAYLRDLPDSALYDAGYTTARRRSHLDHRIAVVGATGAECAERLDSFLREDKSNQLHSGQAIQGVDYRLAFVFSGQGSQWQGMGARLFQQEPTFRRTVERIDELLRKHTTQWSLAAEIGKSEADSRMGETQISQPAIFAVQVGLVELLKEFGIRPQGVVGHSVGEVAAAYAAGILTLEDATLVIYHRSRLMNDATGLGKMAAVGLDVDAARSMLDGFESKVAIAAINSPGSIVFAGETAALEAILAKLPEDTYRKLLPVDYAFHSPQMEPFRKQLETELAGLKPAEPAIPLYSTVTGRLGESGAEFAPLYWGRNMRNTVSFAPALSAMAKDRFNVFLEIGPHPVLSIPMEQCLESESKEGAIIPTLRRSEHDYAAFLAALGGLHANGINVDWKRLYGKGTVVSLPSYPWQRERFWLDHSDTSPSAPGDARRRTGRTHPFLGERVRSAKNEADCFWELDLNLEDFPWIADHKVGGAIVTPGTAYLEMATAAAGEFFPDSIFQLQNIDLKSALILSDDDSRTVQIVLSRENDEVASFSIFSRPANGPQDRWTHHVQGEVRLLASEPARFDPQEQLETLRGQTTPAEANPAEFYQSLTRFGNDYGPTFQGVQDIRISEMETLTAVRAPEGIAQQLDMYRFHPALFDASLHAFISPLAFRSDENRLESSFMPIQLGSVRILRDHVKGDLRAHSTIRKDGARSGEILCDFHIYDAEGLAAEVLNVRVRLLEEERESTLPARPEDWLHEILWEPKESDGGKLAEKINAGDAVIILQDSHGVGDAAAAMLKTLNAKPILVQPGASYSEKSNHITIRLDAQEDYNKALHIALEVGPVKAILHFWSLDIAASDIKSLKHSQKLGFESAVRLLKSVVQLEPDQPPKFWIVTRGAQAVKNSSDLSEPAQAPIWGFGRTLAVENPTLWGGAVDLDPMSDARESAMHALAELAQPDGEDQASYRGNIRFVARLARKTDLDVDRRSFAFRPDGAYLITGGLGGLGLATAHWMASRGARRVILLGRTPLPTRRKWHTIKSDDRDYDRVQGVLSLERKGVSVHLAFLDTADRVKLKDFITKYKADNYPPIRGIMHAAGVGHMQLLQELEPDALEAEFNAKIAGTWTLHELFRDEPLDFFVMFSSASAVLSSPQLGGYAAANMFLDGLAHKRRSEGLVATSINWGFWADAGMAVREGIAQGSENVAPKGMGAFKATEAFELLELTLAANLTQVGVMPFSIAEWSKYYRSQALAPFFARLRESEPLETLDDAPTGDSFLNGLRGAPEQERVALLQEHLRQQIASILKLKPEDVNPKVAVGAMGMDSLMTIEFRNRLQRNLEVTLSATIFFNYPTIEKLTPFLAEKLKLSGGAPPKAIAAATGSAPQRGSGARTPVPAGAAASVSSPIPSAEEIEKSVATLSEEDAESMLLDELSRFE